MTIDKYLRVKQVSELTGLSRATIYALEKAGTFPGKVALGARAVAWRESAIEKWMADRESAVKTAKEAKPAYPRKPRKAKISKDVAEATSAPNQKRKKPSFELGISQPSANSSDAKDDGWGQGDPNPSDEEMAAVRAKLAQKRKQPHGSQIRSSPATGISASATRPGKGISGVVNVLAGPAQRKKAR